MQCLGGSPGHCTSQHRPAPALHMLSFENFVKSMPPSLSELKVTPSFCFAFKIPDDVAASNNHSRSIYIGTLSSYLLFSTMLVICFAKGKSPSQYRHSNFFDNSARMLRKLDHVLLWILSNDTRLLQCSLCAEQRKISMTSNVLPLHFAPSQASSSQNSNVDNF